MVSESRVNNPSAKKSDIYLTFSVPKHRKGVYEQHNNSWLELYSKEDFISGHQIVLVRSSRSIFIGFHLLQFLDLHEVAGGTDRDEFG
jgi:hypothetical protein